MIVIATGPRSNGTTLLYRIVANGGGKTPLHLPAFPPEFRDQDWVEDFPTALFVMILRDLEYAAQSAVDRGFHPTVRAARAEQREARTYLAGQAVRLGERAHLLRLEDLIDDPERELARLNAFLVRHGYEGDPVFSAEPIRDENAKWAERQELAS